VDEGERVPVVWAAEGTAVVDTYTFSGNDQPGTVVGTLDRTGERFVAHVPVDDPLMDLLRVGDGIGAGVRVTSAGGVNTAHLA
jgi:acetyl-CoA C-acetyltransferase